MIAVQHYYPTLGGCEPGKKNPGVQSHAIGGMKGDCLYLSMGEPWNAVVPRAPGGPNQLPSDGEAAADKDSGQSAPRNQDCVPNPFKVWIPHWDILTKKRAIHRFVTAFSLIPAKTWHAMRAGSDRLHAVPTRIRRDMNLSGTLMSIDVHSNMHIH